jgi:hypothetical protein
MDKGDRANECILAMLQTAYTTPEMVARNIQALKDLVASAVSTETFTLFPTGTPYEDKMVTHTPSRLHSRYEWLSLCPLTQGTLAPAPASQGCLAGRSEPDRGSWSQEPHSRSSLARTSSCTADSPRPTSLSPTRNSSLLASPIRSLGLDSSPSARAFPSGTIGGTQHARVCIGCNLQYTSMLIPMTISHPHRTQAPILGNHTLLQRAQL